MMKEYFNKNRHGKNTINDEISVKLPQMRMEFGRKGLLGCKGIQRIASAGKENRISTFFKTALRLPF